MIFDLDMTLGVVSHNLVIVYQSMFFPFLRDL